MLMGVDYYPEHWDRADWEPHAKLMAEGGFAAVRLAEFAWSRMEPREGRFDFGWLDEAIGVLRAHHLKVVLGTPTASPPPWLVTRYPEVLAVNQAGVRTEAGGRRHTCYVAPRYREFARRIVTAMAQHYADHPSVIGWQIDNELGSPRCWCEACQRAFRDWLRSRYGTIEALNAAWGTVFWGQEFSDFQEVPLPRPAAASHSPSIRLDHSRCHSHHVVEFHDLQVDVLRKLCPRHWVTHNGMGFANEVDYFSLAGKLDFFAIDSYPGSAWGSGKDAAAPHDYTRSIKHKPFWVMEQRAGLTGWLDLFQSGDAPGQLRLWTYQAVAHGADAVMLFRWRTSRYGVEQYWHGVLDHHGEPGRRYRELSRVAREFAALGERLEGAAVTAPLGLLADPDSRWALDLQGGSPGLTWAAIAGAYHRAFATHHAAAEYYRPEDDFTRAAVLVAPALFVCPDVLAAKLTDYVQGGGCLVLTFRSGVKDRNNVVIDDRLPGPLKHLAGCVVEEYDVPVHGETAGVDTAGPLGSRTAKASLWFDQLRLTGAKALARYRDGPFKGSPAACVHRYGKGRVVYVGFNGDDAFMAALARWLLKETGQTRPFAPSTTVEIVERTKGKEALVFVLNHAAERQRLTLPPRTRYRDLLTGQKLPRAITLAPHDVRILVPIQAA